MEDDGWGAKSITLTAYENTRATTLTIPCTWIELQPAVRSQRLLPDGHVADVVVSEAHFLVTVAATERVGDAQWHQLSFQDQHGVPYEYAVTEVRKVAPNVIRLTL